jgi:hypothetical protein
VLFCRWLQNLHASRGFREGRIGIVNAFYGCERKPKTMNNNVEEARERSRDFYKYVSPLDAKIARLDERIERNRAELERTNAILEAKIAELLKRVNLNK